MDLAAHTGNMYDQGMNLKSELKVVRADLGLSLWYPDSRIK